MATLQARLESLIAAIGADIKSLTTSLSGKPSLTSTTPTDVSGTVATAGTSTEAARADHKHDVSTSGTPSTQAVGDTATAGTSTALARLDHKHGMPVFGTTAGTIAQGNDSRLTRPGVLVLNVGDAVPGGTQTGTVIFRRSP